ncbi:RNA polymerase sigma factor [Sporosarcina pasteurii]|uniref:RNA polymerase sigma factor sigM n=1 Tax=Sporosarcina pasteurii TaxID=1474 RepID=A0A380BCY1_SPOPA|nr:sigma-70 family RNA polymerase sigma factor [Sporosarcina pasteurii]MDS9472359.1 sigma-70 family RNA polymerase sigma factor [Sporosarcina pasteurii]QBQ06338.1 sigma-70 family RNA polymerase sigma factor [Sporosarcina pasteurii]SUI98928.1 RNA polymerase sigma factor sigM [Sporosarcina pasteurii]
MTIKLDDLYEEYGRYIYHLCLKLTRNKEEAEDVMQDVWVKVIRYNDKLDEIDNIKGWLTTICMNTFRDRYRKTVRKNEHVIQQPHTLDVPILDLVPSNSLTPSEIAERNDIQSLVSEKIGQLDAIYKNTIEYFYVYQYSLNEIAEVMKVSIGTVKSRLFRARNYLKEMLVDDHATYDYVTA